MSSRQQQSHGRRTDGTQGTSNSTTPPDINALAGAVASALQPLLESISGGQCSPSCQSSSQTRPPAGERLTSHSHPAVTDLSQDLGHAAQAGTHDSRVTAQFQRAATLSGPPETKRPRFSFEPPSLFESVRKRRMTAKQTSGKSTAPEIIKVTTYSRDIFLLPQTCKSDSGDVLIPRGNHRSLMGRAGLIGKVQINSTMSESDVRKEICAVFAKPMGLTEEHLRNGQYFPFSYLQKAGSGSRSLCVPSVAPSFEWNGKQVSTLAKAGTFLYVLALEMLPGYEALVNQGDEESTEEVEDLVEQEDEFVGDDLDNNDLPDFSMIVGNLQSNTDSDSVIPGIEESLGSSSTRSCQQTNDATEFERIIEFQQSPLDILVETFMDKFSRGQVIAIYKFLAEDYDKVHQCLMDGPQLSSLLAAVNEAFKTTPRVRAEINSQDMWRDLLACYKSRRVNDASQLQVILSDQPPVDAGGVRRQVYTTVYAEFAKNKHVVLFHGPENYLRPALSVEARSSGLLKLLGKMVAHSICQDGIGFPYLSPLCYWYLVGGEEKALEYGVTLEDLPDAAAHLISQIKNATNDEQLIAITEKSTAVDVLQRIGMSRKVTMLNKNFVIEEITYHEAIGSITKLLDQIASGLSSNNVLSLMKAFPEVFAQMLTSTGKVTSTDVFESIIAHSTDEDEEVVIEHFKRFVNEATEDVLKKFLIHTTGSIIPHERSISILFHEEEAISSHTCGREIYFPKKAFVRTEESYELFKMALLVVMDPSYNLV